VPTVAANRRRTLPLPPARPTMAAATPQAAFYAAGGWVTVHGLVAALHPHLQHMQLVSTSGQAFSAQHTPLTVSGVHDETASLGGTGRDRAPCDRARRGSSRDGPLGGGSRGAAGPSRPMSWRIELHPEARVEALEADAWYSERNPARAGQTPAPSAARAPPPSWAAR
jgi:hypothetical protein